MQPVAPGTYRGIVSPNYSIGPYPNGGYILGIAVSALAAELPHPDPLAVSAHFFTPATHGQPIDIAVDRIRSGRSTSSAEARATQDGVERMRVLATFADLSAMTGPTVLLSTPPQLPPPDECVGALGGSRVMPNGLDVAIRDRFDTRIHPDHLGWARGERSGRGVLHAWVRFADGRPPDTISLPLVCDALPPAVFDLTPTGWVPTIEYTVLVRGRPVNGWLRMAVQTRALIGGYLEEDVEVWDAAGALVAQSRQLARANTPS